MGYQSHDPFGVLASGVANGNGCGCVCAHSQLSLLCWFCLRLLLATLCRTRLQNAATQFEQPLLCSCVLRIVRQLGRPRKQQCPEKPTLLSIDFLIGCAMQRPLQNPMEAPNLCCCRVMPASRWSVGKISISSPPA